jgi:hypothetical protein
LRTCVTFFTPPKITSLILEMVLKFPRIINSSFKELELKLESKPIVELKLSNIGWDGFLFYFLNYKL